MKVDVLLGLQWGDEGKGKIVDVFTPKYDIIARFQGGPNAGHTLEFNGMKHVLHTIPSGIFHPQTMNVIGNGVIIDLKIFKDELDKLIDKGAEPSKNLLISKKSHMILPSHRMLDAAYEQSKGKQKIGSTLKGIGPTYTDKTARVGLRIGDILAKDFTEKYEKLKARHMRILETYNFDINSVKVDGLQFDEYEKTWLNAIKDIKKIPFIDSEHYINQQLTAGKKILAEGAQGTLLDVDFGSFPFVTSSNTVTAAVCTGLGIAPSKIGKVYGVFKAYCTRVGSGPFPSELFDEVGQKLRDNGHEYGSTTGRPRRCGWLDLPALKYAIMIDGVTDLIITKADVMDDFDEINICTSYQYQGKELDYLPYEIAEEDMQPQYTSLKGWKTDITEITDLGKIPQELKDFIKFVEDKVSTPVTVVSTGPDRKQTMIKQ